MGAKHAGFELLEYDGGSDQTYKDTSLIRAAWIKLDPSKGWTIQGLEQIPVQLAGEEGWCLIPASSDNDEAFEVTDRFDTVEQAVAYCTLMDNT